jgi:hypothetical protein
MSESMILNPFFIADPSRRNKAGSIVPTTTTVAALSMVSHNELYMNEPGQIEVVRSEAIESRLDAQHGSQINV